MPLRAAGGHLLEQAGQLGQLVAHAGLFHELLGHLLELAPLVGLSEAGTSKHLRLLAEAGLVARRREGYYVVYSLVDDRLELLAADVRRLA